MAAKSVHAKNNVGDTEAIMQVFFAENNSAVSQNEIQSAHWTHPQISIFTYFASLKVTEYYNKGEVVAKDVDPKEDFKNLPSDTVIVRVKHGSKVRNIMGFVEKSLKDEATRCMIFSGCGDAIEKTITCVEIAKTKFRELHQITKLNTLRVEEYWEPTKPDLDRLQVTREIPMVSILLSKDAVDSSELGYQEPGNPIKMKKSFKRKKTFVKEPSTSKDNSKSTEVSPTE